MYGVRRRGWGRHYIIGIVLQGLFEVMVKGIRVVKGVLHHGKH